MIALGIDFLAAYLLTRAKRNTWLLVVLAALAGFLSAIMASFAMYAISYEVFSPGEIVARVVSGMVLHPIVTVVAVFVIRRFQDKEHKVDVHASSSQVSDPVAAVDEITQFVQFLQSLPSDEEIAERTRLLLASGYDAESLMDLVRERAGVEEVDLVRKVIVS